MGFPGGAVVKNLPTDAGDTRVQSLGREDPPEQDPFLCSCLENSVDGGAWGVQSRVSQSQTQPGMHTYTSH